MEHTRKFRGDLSAIRADLRSIQSASGRKVVRLGPGRIDPPSASSRSGKAHGWCPPVVFGANASRARELMGGWLTIIGWNHIMIWYRSKVVSWV